jgi:hypothetical protein
MLTSDALAMEGVISVSIVLPLVAVVGLVIALV